MLKAKGLYTFQNYLSFIPEGSLLDATNVVIDRDGIIEPRRGITQYGTVGVGTASVPKQMLTYKNQVLVHHDDVLAYDNGTGTFTDYVYPSSNDSVPTIEELDAGLRLKYIESNGNLYVTNSIGVVKLASDSSDLSTAKLTFAGGINALDGSATINYSAPGWFTGLSMVAYRIVWGTTDINSNEILGAPSSRIVVTNFDTSSATTDVTFTVPSTITTDYFYQIYRTGLITQATVALLNDSDPGDEMQLVYEAPVTSVDIAAKSITIHDIAPESFRQGGTYLYTNPVTGNGILQAYYPPPLCKDIALYKGSAFYANTRAQESLALSMIGVGNLGTGFITNYIEGSPVTITSPSHGLTNGQQIAIVGTGNSSIDGIWFVRNATTNTFQLSATASGPLLNIAGSSTVTVNASWYSSYITITDGTTTNQYFFVGRPQITNITFDTAANTADGSSFKIYAASSGVTPIPTVNENSYEVWFSKTSTTMAPATPGYVDIQVDLTETYSQQLLSFSTVPTIGSVTYGWGTGTATVNSSATASTLQTALQTISGLGSVTVTGSYSLGFTVTFVGVHNNANLIVTQTNTLETVATPVIITIAQTVAYSSPVPFGTNIANYVLTTILNATNDFLIDENDPILTFTTANSGTSTDAIVGSPSPGGAFAISTIQEGQGADPSKNYALLSTYVSAAQSIDATARSLVSIINQNSSEIVYAYYLSGPTDVPGLMNFQRRDTSDVAFSITANNASTGALFNPDLTTAATSTADQNLNRVYFSVFQQPENVPLVNFLDIGPKDKAILRIIPLRDSLFVFKQDAIYRLTGDVAPNFTVILFDNSVHMIAPDSGAVLNNQVYALTDGGVATVTETGVGIISRPIENYIKNTTTFNYPNFTTADFGVSYETERSYYLFMVTNTTDTYATQCFRYNTFTQCWTRWDKPQNCAVLNPFNNLMFFGSPTQNLIEVERKTLTRSDYADNIISLEIPANAVVNATTLQLSSTSLLKPGDALVQTQYVTINQYNMLLIKLDSDPHIDTPVFDTDYVSTLTMISGDNLTDKMIDLVAKLNADPGTSGGYVFSGSSDFATIQTEYNTMITHLNSDPKLKFKNYQSSSGTIKFEIPIDSIANNSGLITTDNVPAIMVGPIIAFKSIISNVVWAPNVGSDPSLLKQFDEATILFEQSDFRGGIASYASDLSPGFESITFNMDDNGTWGGSIWGANNWGGSGTSVPFRTYVPRQKQRCRYILCQLNLHDAFYNPAILGISFSYQVSSDRAYRGK